MTIPLVLLGLAALAAGPGPATAAAPARSAPDTTVVIKGFGYAPKLLEVPVGTTVIWRNQDEIEHTVTLEPGDGAVPTAERPLDAPLPGKGTTSRHTFTRAGTYAYVCARHPFMRGTVRVHDTGDPR